MRSLVYEMGDDTTVISHGSMHNGHQFLETATAFGLFWPGLVIASGMIANIGNSVVVDLFSENQDQAVALWLAIITVQ